MKNAIWNGLHYVRVLHEPITVQLTEQVGHERGRRTDFEENTVRHQHEIFTYDLHSIFFTEKSLKNF